VLAAQKLILASKFNRYYMCDRDEMYIDTIKLLILYGARIKDIKLHVKNTKIPAWMYEYESEYHQKTRIAFLYVCRENQIPKDLARDVVKRMIF
jgi:NAD(P)H-flavin reductase